MHCTDVSSGIEKLLYDASIRRCESQLRHISRQQQQPASVLSPYQSTPQQLGLLVPAVTRGSMNRSSASSTEGNVSHAPQSILKQPLVSLGCDVSSNSSVHAALPVLASLDAQGSLSAGSTSINAKSLQRTMPPGADLNDWITEVLTGKTVPQGVTPARKSSLDGPRLGPSPSADVTRSTSLRQPTRSDAEDWLPPKQHSTVLNLSSAPLPVEAHFQRIPFASPMTVTSNPVHSASGAAALSVQMTPPSYHRPPMYNRGTNVEQPTISTPLQSQSLRSNHLGPIPVGRPQNDSMWPSPLAAQSHATVGGDRRPYFDILASETSANSSIQLDSATNGVYRLVPIALAETAESAQLHQANPEESRTVGIAVGKPVAPPSYQMAKSLKMTPPVAKRYFEDIELNHSARLPAHSSSMTASTVASADLTNGDANVHRSYMPSSVRVTNGRHEPVANGPMSSIGVPQPLPMGLAVRPSSGASINTPVSYQRWYWFEKLVA